MNNVNNQDNQQNSQSNLSTETIPKLFIQIVIPSTIAMIIMGIQGMIDGLFLGNFIGANAMASANIAAPFLQIIMGFATVIAIGGNSFIGRMLGQNDVKIAQDIFKSAFLSLTFCSVSIMMIGFLFSNNIAALLGANDILLNGTSQYIKTIAISAPFVCLYMFFAFSNRITGRPELFLIASIVGVVANIILNYLFIVVMELDMMGAALATSSAYIIGFLINIPPMLNKNSIVNIFNGKFNTKLLGQLVYNGSSEGMTSISTAITVLLFNLTFMHFYGEEGVSAFTIISYISQMTTMIMFGIADGLTPIVSYNFGAKLNDRVKNIVCLGIISNFIIGVMAFLIVRNFGYTLIGFFANGNENLIELTYNGAKVYAISFFASGINILISGYFTAIGDALKSVVVSSSRGLIFIIIGIFTLPYIFGVDGVWCVTPFADFITLIISILLLRKAITKQSN